jgi:hypothetical protein
VSDLTRLWLASSDRRRIAAAANEIDQLLRFDPSRKGNRIYAGMLDPASLDLLADRIGMIPEDVRWLKLGPLEVFFSADESDRQARVWQVRLSADPPHR